MAHSLLLLLTQSSFVPLNFSEDPATSKKDLEEEHTRELQIELALQDFEKALQLQRKSQFKEAANQYELLFKLEIISNHYYEEESLIRGVQNGRDNTVVDELSFLSPNVKSLRYHVFRNRAFLYWEMLKNGIYIPLDQPAAANGELDPSIRDMFYTMIDDMVISVVYQEPDEHLLSVMYKIFAYLGLKRLLRYSIEYALSGEIESDDIITTLSINDKVKSMYSVLLKHIAGDDVDFEPPGLDKELRFLAPVRDDFQSQISKVLALTDLKIKIKSKNTTWLDVLVQVDQASKSRMDKEKTLKLSRARIRNLEPYLLTDSQWDRITIESKEVEEIERHVSEPPEEPEIKPDDFTDGAQLEPAAEEPEKDIKEGKEDKEERQIQRSSKRFKQQNVADLEDIDLQEDFFAETTVFFTRLSQLISKACNLDEKVVYLGNIVETFLKPEDGYLNEFIDTLNDWHGKAYTDALFGNETTIQSLAKEEDDAKIKLLDILDKFGSKDSSSVHAPSIETFESSNTINEILQEWSETSMHYLTFKVQILAHLLVPNFENPDAVCLTSDSTWPTELVSITKEWILQASDFLLEKLNSSQATDVKSAEVEAHFLLAVGILEFLVDSYSSARKEVNKLISQSLKKVGSKNDKSNLSVVATELLRTGVKILKWEVFVKEKLLHIGSTERSSHLFLFKGVCRYKWTMIHYERSRTTNWQDVNVISESIDEVNRLLELLDHPIELSYANFSNIPELTKDSPQSELTVISVLSMFAKVLSAKSGGDTNEAIKIMEAILLEDTNESDVNEKVLSKLRMFLGSSPVDMSLSLWDILFLFYEESGQLARFQNGFEVYSDSIINTLQSQKYNESESTSKTVLLRVLGSFSTSLSKFVTMLESSSWNLASASADVLLRYFKLLELFYMFSLHEEASLITSRKRSVEASSTKAYNAFKDAIVRLESLLIIYVKNLNLASSDSQLIRNLVALTHEQLGGRRMCDCSTGLYLRLIQDILLELGPKKFSTDVAQILLCRFHCSLAINGVSPEDHATKSTEKFDKNTAITVIKFVLPICFEMNPISNPMKSDVRSLVDLLYEEIGDPDIDTDLDARKGQEMLEYFLDSTSLSPRFMKNAFHGLMDVSFRSPDDPESPKTQVADLGLYFLQGNIIFTTYKIRKKSMQIRAVELEHVITLLQNDLLFCPWRAESWFLLGQVYGYFVQDELTWTADKLQSDEKKVGPANIQRKSLICYFMAINQCARTSDKFDYKPMVGQLMESFSRELFNACTPPMSLHAFKVTKNPRFINDGSGGEFVTVERESVASRRICLKILQQVLHLAIRASPTEWSNIYILSKVQRKIKLDPTVVIETLLTSCEAATKANNGVIEPRYKLCSILFKYVQDHSISIEYAAKCLHEEFPAVDTTAIHSEEDFIDTILKCLREIISQDKKRWQHKPRYRLAKILKDYKNDAEGALEEMSSMISPKSSGKSLVLIWKPDFERPGKHFCYTYQYACFYMETSITTKNLSNLFFMMPKLKKSNSIMINTVGAWSILTSSVCQVVRDRCGIISEFTEFFIMYTIYYKFTAKMKFILDKITTEGVPPPIKPYFCLNHDFVELKRMNTGFGPTALIDDTLIAILIIMYLYYDEKYELDKVITAVDAPTNKRLAKKEILPLLTELAKKAASKYEAIMKEDPDIYAKFLKLEWPDTYECRIPFKLNEGTATPPPTHAPKMIGNKIVFGKMDGLIGDKIVFAHDTSSTGGTSHGETSKGETRNGENSKGETSIGENSNGHTSKRPNENEPPETKRAKLDNGEATHPSLPL